MGKSGGDGDDSFFSHRYIIYNNVYLVSRLTKIKSRKNYLPESKISPEKFWWFQKNPYLCTRKSGKPPGAQFKKRVL